MAKIKSCQSITIGGKTFKCVEGDFASSSENLMVNQVVTIEAPLSEQVNKIIGENYRTGKVVDIFASDHKTSVSGKANLFGVRLTDDCTRVELAFVMTNIN